MERSGGRARLDTELPMLLLPNHPVTERKRLDMARTPQDADADACAALFSNQNVCHRYASRALALGESHTMIGKLLGHRDVFEEPSWDSHLMITKQSVRRQPEYQSASLI